MNGYENMNTRTRPEKKKCLQRCEFELVHIEQLDALDHVLQFALFLVAVHVLLQKQLYALHAIGARDALVLLYGVQHKQLYK